MCACKQNLTVCGSPPPCCSFRGEGRTSLSWTLEGLLQKIWVSREPAKVHMLPLEPGLLGRWREDTTSICFWGNIFGQRCAHFSLCSLKETSCTFKAVPLAPGQCEHVLPSAAGEIAPQQGQLQACPKIGADFWSYQAAWLLKTGQSLKDQQTDLHLPMQELGYKSEINKEALSAFLVVAHLRQKYCSLQYVYTFCCLHTRFPFFNRPWIHKIQCPEHSCLTFFPFFIFLEWVRVQRFLDKLKRKRSVSLPWAQKVPAAGHSYSKQKLHVAFKYPHVEPLLLDHMRPLGCSIWSENIKLQLII